MDSDQGANSEKETQKGEKARVDKDTREGGYCC